MKKVLGMLLICIGSIIILLNLYLFSDFIEILFNTIKTNNWGYFFGSLVGAFLIFIIGFLPLVFGIKLVRKSKKENKSLTS